MKIITSYFFLALLFSSCSSGLKPRGVEQFYTSTGIERYFLSDIPTWANFSQSAGCFRNKGIRYFDMNALMKSFSLSMAEGVQIQAMFNEEYLVIKERPNVTLSVKDEEVLFFKAKDKVTSKIVFFEPPTFKRVHLIWLDEALQGSKQLERLKAFMLSSIHDEGVPVLISACLTKTEVNTMFPGQSIKAITAELFSIYDESGARNPNMHVNLSAFFKAEQKIFFYTQSNKKTFDDIRGTYKSTNY